MLPQASYLFVSCLVSNFADCPYRHPPLLSSHPSKFILPSPTALSPVLSSHTNYTAAVLQESPEVVPTGEMPRNIIVVLDRNLVDKVSPGTRVSIMGIASLYNSAAAKKQVGGVAIRTPFMQVDFFSLI